MLQTDKSLFYLTSAKKHVNTVCRQNSKYIMLNLVVNRITIRPKSVKGQEFLLGFPTIEDGADRLPRKFGKELPLHVM